ncbi:elongation factor P 5-aminopentanone reductase [Indiicoccus explosivorum]|uniref:elongation factor P 5-aminopentanone reductase n=1 Tax=Indiicoccus explosivorum TaxID=1917864 RepID=UPI000B444FA8|nr:SDR family oxidoreductase [Indiicoccus explosivorum]
MKRFGVVLGASGDIGKAISVRLAEQGWSLYLHWNSRYPAELIDSLESRWPSQEFIAVQADFRSENGGEKLAGQVYDASCVIIACGQGHYGLLAETAEEDLEDLWRVHVKNPLSVIKRLSRFFSRHDSSYVVFVSSIWGETGAAMETAYSAVKGAQIAFVRAYAKEMAGRGTRVNAIAPGMIRSKMNDAFTDEETDEITRGIPLGIGSPEDVANAAAYLTGGGADYLTGQVIRVNGGWLI